MKKLGRIFYCYSCRLAAKELLAMDAYSWLRRSFSKLKNTSLPSATTTAGITTTSGAVKEDNKSSKLKITKEEEEEQLYGITDQLIEFVKSFTLETFNNFSIPDEEGSSGGNGGNSGNVRKELSDWQETHAVLVLSRVKELAQLRFQLCPRYLKERQFWRIYFMLVRSYVIEYELRAVRLAKVKQIIEGNETLSDSSTCEVEMSEAKFIMPMESAASMKQK